MAGDTVATVAGEAGRLAAVRRAMAAEKLDLLVVRATDAYLNEYVPLALSLRAWLSGFTGSVGDVLVGADAAWLLVDGRYYLQAERETDPARFEMVRVPLGETIDDALEAKLVDLARRHGAGLRVGYEPEKVPVELFDRLRAALGRHGAELVAPAENLVGRARGPVPAPPLAPLEPVAAALTGESSAARLERVRARLAADGVDGLLVTRLDEVAWLTNLRAYEIDYASTFRSLAYVGADRALLFVDPAKVTEPARRALGPGWRLHPEAGWVESLAAELGRGGGRPLRVRIDPAGTTVAARAGLERALAGGGEAVAGESPLQAMKARKGPRELETMVDSFRRADTVVETVIRWLNRAVAAGRKVTEQDLAERVEQEFRAAGARGLSFRVIAAAGSSGAVIHYSHPDPERRIRKGELVLVDTGAYFAPGYATDLTRTFLAGGAAARATARQKQVYTAVLKGAIRGMKARFPAGTTGVQLDAVVRAPIWEAGFDYLHGTGHGVGILVHEFPPRVTTRGSVVLEPGMVFSIEPGVYLAGWGGVRIENLVTVVEDDRVQGFLRVKPLTFAALDRCLIEPRLLTIDEKQWLRQYRRGRA